MAIIATRIRRRFEADLWHAEVSGSLGEKADMRRRWCSILLGLIGLYLVGCLGCRSQQESVELVNGTTTPMATLANIYPTDCLSPENGFVQIHPNPCLEQPTDVANGILQMVPAQYAVYSIATADVRLIRMQILCNEEGCSFFIGVMVGETGYETYVILDKAACLVIQVAGSYMINDPAYHVNRLNYGMRAWLRLRNEIDMDLGMIEFSSDSAGSMAPYWIVQLPSAGVYRIRVGVVMQDATAKSGYVRIESIGIAEDLEGQYCSMPEM